MKLKIEFECDNSSFEDNLIGEIHRILMEIPHKIYSGEKEGTLRDVNGNKVGFYEYK